MKKKILSLTLVICIIFALLAGFPIIVTANQSTAYAGGFSNNYTLTGNAVSDIVAVANAQIGKTQTQLHYTEAWCDNFISDCAILANQAKAIPQGGTVADFRNNVINAGGYYVATPSAGDLAIFMNGNSCEHTAIFVDSVYCVNGNLKSSGESVSSVKKRKYSDTCSYNGWSCKFLRPNYNSSGMSIPETFDDYYKLTAPDGFQSLRSSASTSANELARIPAGTIVNVTKYNSDKSWGYLTYEGKSGWIRLYYVQKTEKPHTHAYNSTWTKDSTYHWKVCTGCGNVGNKSIHTWNSGSITKQPNCNNTGTKTYTCTVCGATKTETIAKNSNHNFVNGKCSVCGLTNRKDFPDVSYTAWYGDSVAYAVEAGFMTGYANGKFGTTDGIQRQDFVIILSRISGDDLSVYKGRKSFKDVDPNAYYAAALAWAKAKGVSNGYNDGSFGVGRKVTREQIMTFLHNYAKLKKYSTTVSTIGKMQILVQYPDFGNVSDFAKEATYWALSKGVISGKQVNGKRYISPGSSAQRCEVAAMFYNINKKGIFA